MNTSAGDSTLPRLGLSPMLLAIAGCALLVLPQIVVIITSIDPSPAAIFPPKGISFEWYANHRPFGAIRDSSESVMFVTSGEGFAPGVAMSSAHCSNKLARASP